MKFKWNLVGAVLHTKIDDLEALRQKDLKIKGGLMWFYQIGLFF